MSKILLNLFYLTKIKLCLLVGLIVFSYGISLGQTTRTFNKTNDLWNTAINWTPNGVPGPNDNAIIPASVTTITNIPNTTINSLEIQGTSGSVTFQTGPNGENFLSVTSSFSIQSGKTLNLNLGTGQRRISMAFSANCTATVNGVIEIEGRSNANEQGIIVNGIMSMGPNGLIRNTANSAYFTLASGATLRIGSPLGISSSGLTGNIQTTTRNFNTESNYSYIGSANQIVGNGLPATLNSLTIANTGATGSNTVTLNATRTITSNLSVLSGTFNLSTFTANRAAVGGTLTLAANTNLLVGGTNNFPTNYTTRNIDCASIVNYNAAGNQTIGAVNYGNLVLSGSGAKTLQAGTTQICTNFTLTGTASSTAVIGLAIGGNVGIGTGTTFSAASFTHTIGGNWTRTGTFTANSSTINFNGTNPGIIQSTTFNNLTFSGAGAKTASGNLTINGNLLISNNFNAGNFAHTLTGNWTNNGTFTPSNSTISFTGSVAQTISGTSASPFEALIINNTLSVAVNSPISVAANLNLSNGDFNTYGNLTMGDESQILLTNSSAELNGTIQGTGDYDVVYQGGSRPTGGELSGASLRNITLTSTSGSTITATSNFTMKGQLNIPTGVTLNMGSFSIGPTLITTIGGGQLQTQSISPEPLPQDVTWSFTVKYTRLTAGQTIVYGIYENLEILSTSGTNTMEPEGNGDFVIRSQMTVPNPTTVDAGDSRVEFNGFAAQTIPGLAYKKLVLTGNGDKNLDAAATILIELSINPTAIAKLGNTNRSVERLILNGAAQAVGSYGSTASAATNRPVASFGSTGTGILNVTGICLDGKWTGTVSSVWFTAANWCNGTVPLSTTDVLISAAAPFQPVINAASAVARNLVIEPGASLTISGTFTFSVHGVWTNSGTFNSGISSTVDFTGTPNASINTGSFANVSFTGSGTKTLNSTITVSENITPVSTSVSLVGNNTLTLNSGKTMEILSTGSLNTVGGAKLILESGSTFVNRSTSNPTLEVRQTLTGTKGWRMIGAPATTTYTSLTSGFETQGFLGSTSPTLQSNLLWWDETDKGTTNQGWRQPSNLSATAPAGRGHYFYVFNGASKPGGGNYTDNLPKTISVTGTEVNLASGSFNFGVSFTLRDTALTVQGDSLIEVNKADQGFNMLANPTASTIDFHSGSGWTKTNIDQTIYIWDPVINAFRTWNGTSGDLGSGRIAPFQAFWVKTNAASPSLLLSGNGSKTLTSTSFFGRKLDTIPPTLELNVAGEGMQASSLITFGEDGKLGADPKDAYQLESLADDWLLLYSFGSSKTKSPLVINHQPEPAEDRVIPLHLAASKKGEPINGTYLMDWKVPAEWPVGIEIVLMDHINQKAIDMRKESMYSFGFEAPKAPLSNARKTRDGLQIPQAVVFQTPYETGATEEISLANFRLSETAGPKPKRPFTIFIGEFPDGRIEYLPELPRLFAPVPNPFSSQTKLRFYLPIAEKAAVSIYNLLGEEVGSFPAKDYESGIQELEWIPSSIDLPSGMYIIRLSTTTGQFTQKLVKN